MKRAICCTTGRSGRAPSNLRRNGIGAFGCYWPDAGLGKHALSPNGRANRPSKRPVADARDVLVEGASGILAVSPDWFRPVYEPSKRRLTWPNGTIATIFSADEPDRLRSPQHHWAVCDELAAWRYPDAWNMLMFGLRLGDDPRCAVATTPRRFRPMMTAARPASWCQAWRVYGYHMYMWQFGPLSTIPYH